MRGCIRNIDEKVFSFLQRRHFLINDIKLLNQYSMHCQLQNKHASIDMNRRMKEFVDRNNFSSISVMIRKILIYKNLVISSITLHDKCRII